MRALPLLPLLLCSCYATVSGLDPKPNIPSVRNPPSMNIVLSDDIKQKVVVSEQLVLDSFRGDLKRGFYNGFPGATKTNGADLVLTIESVEPSYTCFQYVGCTVKLRFKGRLASRDAELASFAADAKSDICTNNIATCCNTAIEGMYERIFDLTKEALAGPKTQRAPRNNTTEL